MRSLFKLELSIWGTATSVWHEATKARTGTEDRQSQAGWIAVPGGKLILISLLTQAEEGQQWFPTHQEHRFSTHQ